MNSESRSTGIILSKTAFIFGGLPDHGGVSRLRFICNMLAHVEATGWKSGNYYNQDWGGGFNYAYSITKFAWGDYIYPRLDFFLQRSVNPCTAQHHVRDKFLCCRRQERLWCQYKYSNPLVNPLVHRRSQDRDGPVTQ